MAANTHSIGDLIFHVNTAIYRVKLVPKCLYDGEEYSCTVDGDELLIELSRKSPVYKRWRHVLEMLWYAWQWEVGEPTTDKLYMDLFAHAAISAYKDLAWGDNKAAASALFTSPAT